MFRQIFRFQATALAIVAAFDARALDEVKA